jgi:choline dehydrogenase-like flavoprotein
VIEAGGVGAIDSTAALAFDRSDTQLEPAGDSRWRTLSGTAAIWNVRLRNRPAGRYVPLSEIDFESRGDLPFSGWPFRLAALEPYYRRAEELAVHVEPHAFDEYDHPRVLNLDARVATTTFETFGFACVFTEQLPSLLRARPDVTIITNAMVTGIGTSAVGDRAEEVAVVAKGHQFKVRFRVLVLAAGGIENARLLLVSNDRHPRGLGNQNGLVGRFFMDHPRILLGHLKPFDPVLFEETSAYDIRLWEGRYLGGKVTLAESLIRDNGLLNASIQLLPHPNARDFAALNSLKELLASLRRGRFNRETVHNAAKVLAGSKYLVTTGVPLARLQRSAVPVVSYGGWSTLRRNRHRFESFELVLQSEQSPHPDNRVTLGSSLDEFGLRRATVTSRWRDVDVYSIRETTRIVAAEFRRARVGEFVPVTSTSVPPQLYQRGGAHHHIGTTRMHGDATQGVVNENSRIHGMENVYVAGSSIFPTGGYANPTLTLLALTFRLADHLKTQR